MPACVHHEGFLNHDRRASSLHCICSKRSKAHQASTVDLCLASQAESLQEGALSCAVRLVEAAPHLLPHVHSVLSHQHGAGGLPFFISGSFLHCAVPAGPRMQPRTACGCHMCPDPYIKRQPATQTALALFWYVPLRQWSQQTLGSQWPCMMVAASDQHALQAGA